MIAQGHHLDLQLDCLYRIEIDTGYIRGCPGLETWLRPISLVGRANREWLELK